MCVRAHKLVGSCDRVDRQSGTTLDLFRDSTLLFARWFSPPSPEQLQIILVERILTVLLLQDN
jgi:hypothetical protein